MKFNETDLTQLHEDLQTKKISAKELTKAALTGSKKLMMTSRPLSR